MFGTGDGLGREWVVVAADKRPLPFGGRRDSWEVRSDPREAEVIPGRLWGMGLVGGDSIAWTITDIAGAQL